MKLAVKKWNVSRALAMTDGTKENVENTKAKLSIDGIGWVGVVASPNGLTRMLQDENPWWCLPRTAMPGSIVAMYATFAASAKRQGIFGVFRLIDFDSERDGECKIYGKGITYFARLKVITRLEQSVALKVLRSDPVLGVAPCVRQNFQGTIFKLYPSQLRQLMKLTQTRIPIESSQA